MKAKPLYSMRRLERTLGVNRHRLLGRVEGLRIQTFTAGKSIAIDADGLKRLMDDLGLKAVPA